MFAKPSFDETVLVCPGAAIVGNVTLGKNVSVWYNAVLRGDEGTITVGENTNIQDCAVLHEETHVGAAAPPATAPLVHGCTVGDNVLIGMGATVLSGAKIGNNCIVGAGALVTGKMDAPAGLHALRQPCQSHPPADGGRDRGCAGIRPGLLPVGGGVPEINAQTVKSAERYGPFGVSFGALPLAARPGFAYTCSDINDFLHFFP